MKTKAQGKPFQIKGIDLPIEETARFTINPAVSPRSLLLRKDAIFRKGALTYLGVAKEISTYLPDSP